MSDRFKYSMNGVYRFENVPVQIAKNRFEDVVLGSLGLFTWSITLMNRDDDDIVPVIFCESVRITFKHCVRLYLNVINTKNSDENIYKTKNQRVLEMTDEFIGSYIPLLDVLNLKNGFLDENGDLSVEYGIQVVSIIGQDRMWRFNFYDEIADKENMIHFDTRGLRGFDNYYCPRHLLSFHSTHFESQSHFRPSCRGFPVFLQIAHGIRHQDYFEKTMSYIRLAEQYKMWNVKRFCEQDIIEDDSSIQKMSRKEKLEEAIALNLTRYLIELIRSAGSTKKLLEVLKTSNMEKMSYETMKMIIATCIYGKFLDY